jgi:hypothetical protein
LFVALQVFRSFYYRTDLHFSSQTSSFKLGIGRSETKSTHHGACGREIEIQFRSTCRLFMECESEKLIYVIILINRTGNLCTLIRPCSSSESGRRADIEALLGGRPIQLK